MNSNKSVDYNKYYDKSNGVILDKVFDNNKSLKEPKDFNNWFNEQFN